MLLTIILIVVYLLVALGIFFGSALIEDTPDIAPWAIFWPFVLVFGLAAIIAVGPFLLLFGGLAKLHDMLTKWAKDKRKSKKLAEKKVSQIEIEVPISQIDYRHMNCQSCGQAINNK